MTTDASETLDRVFQFADAPMARDRGAGWAYFRSFGDVFEVPGDGWYITSHEGVKYGMQHPEIFSSARAFDFTGSPMPMIPIAVDPPDHARYRRVLDPMLSPRVLKTMEAGLRLQVSELIDGFAQNGSCDVIQDLARLYPTQVFLTLFGLPLEDRDKFIDWVEFIVEHAIGLGLEPDAEQQRVAGELFGYMQNFVADKRQHPGDDMLSRILAIDGEGAWNDQEILGLCFLFTMAGLDTVTAQIGFSLLYLAKDPVLRHQLQADPSLLPAYVEEVLRLEPPAPMPPRVLLEPVEISGVRIPAGSKVYLVLAAANRDPSRYSTPNSVNLETSDRGHLGFGGGIHRCVGSHLARKELHLVLEEFHKRVPDYELAPGADPQIAWPAGTLHLTSLPLVFASGARQ